MFSGKRSIKTVGMLLRTIVFLKYPVLPGWHVMRISPAMFLPTKRSMLFACTARGFGRRALAVDAAIGFVLGLVIFLVFAKLLTLLLPAGPLERLFL